MCEIPNNVIQVDAFSAVFDGFSIGSMTHAAHARVDRDSEIVAFDFDERDPGMLEMLRLAVTGAKRNAGTSAFAARPRRTTRKSLNSSRLGIDSISVNPSSLVRTITVVREAEQSMGSGVSLRVQ